MEHAAFRNPPTTYRNIPFWSWNDHLDDEQLSHQMREMAAQHWGGFFMHARIGLYTPYMSEDWMARVRHCIEVAKELGLEAWLYDEDRWPSGFAGGAVPALGPKYRQKNLVCAVDTIEDEPELVELYRCYRGRIEGGNLSDVAPIDPKEAELAKAEGYSVLYLYQRTHPIGYRRFNGYCYPDFLDPDVTDAFLQSTHEKYYESVGEEFGKTVPGIFIDEPCAGYRSTAPRSSVQWTPAFPQIFRATYGYDILDHLLSLFYDFGDYQRVRFDYWNLLSDLFRRNFTERIYTWCDAHGLKLTGHFMAEDTLSGQIEWHGGLMHHYEYMHYPGIDHLGRNVHNDITALQCASVARQLGKGRVLSETFGASGQNTSLEDLKWITDWHLIHGFNLINSHLSLYSMRGCRKRDWPPNIFFQQPYWPYMKELSDYIARGCYAVSQGEPNTDILLLHPLESGWLRFRPTDRTRVKELNDRFVQVIEALLGDQRMFDLGDERIMSRHASVQGNKLIVGRQVYRIVIVPPCDTLRASTIKLLKQFAEAGGSLIWLDAVPSLVDGRQSEAARELGFTGEVVPAAKLIPHLSDVLPRAVRVVRPGTDYANEDQGLIRDVRVHVRTVNGKLTVFLANNSRDTAYDAEVRVPAGRVTLWDLETGVAQDLSTETAGKDVSFRYRFEGAGSCLLTIDPDAPPVTAPAPRAHSAVWEGTLPSFWQVKRLQPNALTLDMCQVKIEGHADWSEPLYTVLAMRTLWEEKKAFSIRHTFVLDEIPAWLHLVMEEPGHYTIWCNGTELTSDRQRGPWLDWSLTRIDISDLVRVGTNEIVYSGTYQDGSLLHELNYRYMERQGLTYDPTAEVGKSTEVEAVYLIGDFGVWPGGEASFRIGEEVSWVTPTDLVGQGYPFYAGTVELVNRFNLPRDGRVGRIRVALEGLRATVCAVQVNDAPWQTIWKKPHAVDFSAVRPGQNVIRLRLVNTLQNLLGPHHQSGGADLKRVSPGTFTQQSTWTDAYHFVPFGIEGVRLVGYRE